MPKNNQILLTHQSLPESEFQLPGGGIDPGEQPIAALHREVFEETGWHIANPIKLGVYKRFVFMPDYEIWAEKICHIFLADPIYPHAAPLEKNHRAFLVSISKSFELIKNDGDLFLMHDYFS